MKYTGKKLLVMVNMLAAGIFTSSDFVFAEYVKVEKSDTQTLKFNLKTGFTGCDTINIKGERFIRPNFTNAFINPEANENGAPAKYYASETFAVPGENSFTLAEYKILKENSIKGTIAPIPEFLTDEMKYLPDKAKYESAKINSRSAKVFYKGIAGGKYLAQAEIPAAYFDNLTGEIHIIEEVEITINFSANPEASARENNSSLSLANSAAAAKWNTPKLFIPTDKSDKLQGDDNQQFAKIAVETEGAYYISAAELLSLGIGTSREETEKIKIYGYGGNILNEDVENADYAELPEQSVVRMYDANGNFDKIVFYATPAKGLYRHGKEIEKYINPYSSKSYYLMSWGGSAKGKTAVAREFTGESVDNRPDSYRHYIYDETDTDNPFSDGSGRHWFNRVSFPYVITNQLYNLDRNGELIYTFAVMHKLYQSGSVYGNFTFSENGEKINTISIPAISGSSYDGSAASNTYSVPANRIAGDDRSIIKAEYATTSASAYGTPFLDYYIMSYPRSFAAINGELSFFADPDLNSSTEYTMTNFASGNILAWDVTNPANPQLLNNYSNTGSVCILRANPTDSTENKFFVASNFRKVSPEKITFTNLLNEQNSPDIIVITHQNLKSSADAYAEYRNKQGKYTAKAYSTADIFNEFGCGMQDPTAIRNFIEYKYRMSPVKPRFVLLWGDGHFDYRNITTNIPNFVPTYETSDEAMTMFNATDSYCTDDYFACVEGEDDLLDLAVGRMPVRSNEDGLLMLEKINIYENKSVSGDWKSNITYIADDKDLNNGGIESLNHVPQSEGISNIAASDYYQKKKIYSVNYPTELITAGRRKPKVTEDILSSANTAGTLLMTFIGHGNPRIWTHEEILERDLSLPRFSNLDKLFFCYAATCDFGRFDMGEISSGAEDMVRLSTGGAIGVFTPSRSVLILSNGIFSNIFMGNFFNKTADNKNQTMGEMVANAKNLATKGNTVNTVAKANDRKYILFGDPAVTLHLPNEEVKVSEINGLNPADTARTIELKGLARVNVKAAIRRADGSIDTDFNGTAIITLLDASEVIEVPEYTDVNRILKQGNALGKTSAQVINGEISGSLFIPQDISFSSENATLMVFAQKSDEPFTAQGGTKNIKVREIDENAMREQNPPSVEVFLDSREFENGSLVSAVPLLLVDLADDTGINTSGAGIGHKIEAWIDDADAIDLTSLFKNSFSDPKAGSIEKLIYDLAPGMHSVKVRAWDVFNNYSLAYADFKIGNADELMIIKTYMYPNPMTDAGNISVTHTASENYDVEIKIYNSVGNLIRTLKHSSSNLNKVITEFDGYDEYGNSLSGGAYFYSVKIKNKNAEGLGHGKFIIVK